LVSVEIRKARRMGENTERLKAALENKVKVPCPSCANSERSEDVLLCSTCGGLGYLYTLTDRKK